MDFILFSTLLYCLVATLTLSYDICCQWSRNAKKQILQLPEAMQVALKILLKKVKYVIPKFHLHNHGLKCHLWFNRNFLQYSAQSDLEDPKRWWAHINPISMSMREMMRAFSMIMPLVGTGGRLRHLVSIVAMIVTVHLLTNLLRSMVFHSVKQGYQVKCKELEGLQRLWQALSDRGHQGVECKS